MEASDCPICYTRYERPLILSCGHSLCTACVDRMKQVETARGVGGGAFRAFMDPGNEDFILEQRDIVRRFFPPVPPPPGGANAGGGAAAADPNGQFNDAGAFDHMRVMQDALAARDFLPAPGAGGGGGDRLGIEGMMQAAGVLRGRLRERGENRDVQHRIKCPECRVETIIPRNGLPINYRLQDVLSREAPSTSSAGATPAQPPAEDTKCMIKCQVCRCDLRDSYFTCSACCPAQQGNPTPFCPRCAIHFHNGHDVEEVVPVTDNERSEAKSDIEASLAQVNNLFEESTQTLAGDTDTWNDTSEGIVAVITAMTALVDEVAQPQLMRPRALQLVQLAQQAYSEVDLLLNKYRNFRRHLQECAALMRLTAERVTALMNGQEMPPATNHDTFSARDLFPYRYAGPAARRGVMDRAAAAGIGNENDPMWRRVDVMRRLREARRAERRVEGYRRDAREAARINDAPIDVVGDHMLGGNGQADAAPQLNNNIQGVVDVQPMEQEQAVHAAQVAGVEMPFHVQDNMLNVDLNARLPPAGTIYVRGRRQEVLINGVDPTMHHTFVPLQFGPAPLPNGGYPGHFGFPQPVLVPHGHMPPPQPPHPIHNQFNPLVVVNPASSAPASGRRIARASASAGAGGAGAAAPAREDEHATGLVQGGQDAKPGGSAGDAGAGGEDGAASDAAPPVKKVRRRRSGSGPGSRS